MTNSRDQKGVMLRQLAEHARLVSERLEARDIAIRGARAAGASLREIGAVAGLTGAGVKHVVDRGQAPDIASLFDRAQLEPIGTKYQHWTAEGGFDDTSGTRVLEMLGVEPERWWVVAIRLQNVEGFGIIDTFVVPRESIAATIDAAATTGAVDVMQLAPVETEMWHDTEPPRWAGDKLEPYDLLRHGFKRMDIILMAHRLAELSPTLRVTDSAHQE